MTSKVNPADRSPKGDHNRRLSLGLEPEQIAQAAGVRVEALREYERTGPDHGFDHTVAERVGEALERLERLLPNSEPSGVTLSLHGRSPEDVIDQDAAEQTIREAAYELWDADGRPEGRDQEYWYRAMDRTRHSEAAGRAADDDTVERAVEASRKIGLQREFKKSPDDSVSGGFNQKSEVAADRVRANESLAATATGQINNNAP